MIVVALVAAMGCVEGTEYGLHVEEVDATFGLARLGAARADAGASPSAIASNGSDPPAASGDQEADPSASQEDGGAPSSGTLPAQDAGPSARSCRNVAGFTENVTPSVTERCVRCHDGTKSKATKALDFTTARDPSPLAQQSACREALKAAPDTSEHSPIFAEVNPGDATTVHDFKYPSSMAYMAYRSAVLAWLESETAN